MATKKDLLTNLEKKLNYLTKDDIKIAVNAVLDIMKVELCKKNRIEIRGFGSMSTRSKKYSGKDSRYNTIYFRMSKNVKELLQ